MDFNERMFLKTTGDDYNASGARLMAISRSIRNVAFIDNGSLKTLSVNMHLELERSSKELGEVIDKFTARYKIDEKLPTEKKLDFIHNKLTELYEQIELENYNSTPNLNKNFEKSRRPTWFGTGNKYGPIAFTISSIKHVIQACDSSIAFVNATYKVDVVKDTRYDESNSSKVLKEFNHRSDDFCFNEFNYDELEKVAKENKIDIGSQEYAKLVIKKLRAFKQDLISTVNKYYGKNSRFADLNLLDLCL